MPAGPGETLLSTVYADVHYYFSDPNSKPSHHRFAKGSYAYVYNNPSQQTAKLEVANHAGTPEQDAFTGYVNVCRLSYSYKHPCLVSLTVDPAYALDQSHWALPSWNERNEQKYLYRIHTLDVYLWTEKDASTFLTGLKAAMPSDRLDIRDAPGQQPLSPGLSEHKESMSPVVQQLEKTAIGSSFPPRAESTASAHSLPGPPTPATGVASPQPFKAASPPAQSAPMVYNPAAPAAPEPIAHREKTPPPPDAGTGTGLSAAEKHDSVPRAQYAHTAQSFGGHHPSLPTPGGGYFPGPPGGPPPQGLQRMPSGVMPPPPPGGPPGQQYFPGPPPHASPQPTSPPPHHPSFSRQSTVLSYPLQQQPGPTQYAHYPQSPGFAASIQSPGLQPQTPSFHQQQQQGPQPPTPSMPPPYSGGPAQQVFQPHLQQQQQQTFAYSNYSYSAQSTGQPQHNQHGGFTGDVHSQVYRPTEQEAGHGYKASEPTRWVQQQRQQDQAQPGAMQPVQQQGTGGSAASGGSQGSGRFKLEERVGKMEKGLNKMFKKFDK